MAKRKVMDDAGNSLKKVANTRLSWKSSLKKYWQLYLLLFIPIVYFIVFRYGPMEYIITAFKSI